MAFDTVSNRLQQDPAQLLARAARRIGGWLALIAVLALSLALCGCAALPAGVQRPVSHAITAERGALADLVAASTPAGQQALSGAQLIADGDQALVARIELIRRASQSLDLQTYHIASDGTGLAILRELQAAAGRGVRVRLLVDDLYAAGQDALFAALALQTNVQVRLFNPLPVRSGSFVSRIALSLHEFSRINRRMHNKLFIADATLAVTGGRNIADDYFKRGEASNFIDMDVLASGPVVHELSALFDRFWNSEQAFPVQAFAQGDAAQFAQLSAGAHSGETAAVTPGRRSGVAEQLDRGRLALHFARAELLADGPAKAAGVVARSTRAEVDTLMRTAQTELMIVSPYFVPGDHGLAMIKALTERGVQIGVMTNSLAATDEPLVHSGYAKYRLALLKTGAKLQELGAKLAGKAGVAGNFRSSQGRLHAKLVVIDRSRLFIGSMNMDGRSERHNTELGLLFDSPALAAEAAQTFHSGAQAGTYRLRLAAHEKIEWLADEDGATVAFADEPGHSAALQMKLSLLSVFVAEDLL